MSEDHAQLRVAIVGAGLMGRWHVAAARRAGGHVAAIVDREPALATRLAASVPGARSATRLAEVLADARIDVVHICTPLETHAELATEAIEGNAHVLVEKPLAQSAQSVRTLMQLAQARGRVLCPVHQYVFQRGTEQARTALADAGAVLHVDAVARSAGADGRDDLTRDRIANEILPHALSLIARLAPNLLRAARWTTIRPRPGELRVLGVDDGATISLLASMRGRPTANTLTVTAERATIHLDLFHGFAVVERGRPSRMNKMARPFLLSAGMMGAAAANLARRGLTGETAYPGLLALIRHLYKAIRFGTAPPLDPEEIMLVADAGDLVVAKASL